MSTAGARFILLFFSVHVSVFFFAIIYVIDNFSLKVIYLYILYFLKTADKSFGMVL